MRSSVFILGLFLGVGFSLESLAAISARFVQVDPDTGFNIEVVDGEVFKGPSG